MTEIPRKYVVSPEWNNPESEIKFSAEQSLTPFKEELSKIEEVRYDTLVNEHYEEFPIVVKTKNPAYNPVKWIKTRNPTYNKKKWIKVCAWGKCIKTKNPAYDPKKWIKTKNPLYSPNRYTEIKTGISTVNGFKLSAWVNGKVKLTPYDGNKFNIKVPIKTDGWITLVTKFTPPLVRKPFKGELVVDLNIEVDITNKWCVKLKPNSNFQWRDRLKLDFTYGLKILQVDITKLANPEIYELLEDIEEDIKNSFDCGEFRKQAEEQWFTRKLQISEEFWAIAKPTQISLSQIIADNQKIKIYGGISSEVKITNDITNIPSAGKLPDLKIIEPTKPSINLSLPVQIPYNYVDAILNKEFKEVPIGDDDSQIKGKLIMKEIQTFPSGDNLGLKVKFKTDIMKGLLNVKATAYFTGKLEQRTIPTTADQNRVLNTKKHYLSYTLDTLAFNDFGNGKDKLILGLAYKEIKKSIQNVDDIDITPGINKAEQLLLDAIEELVRSLPESEKKSIKNVDIGVPVVKIDGWAFSKKDLMMLLTAKVEIK